MEILPLPMVGWIYTALTVVALALGAYLVIAVHLGDEQGRELLARRVIDDAVLFGIWILGLAGGIGVLLEKSWSRPLLELFCWVLMVLVILAAASRYRGVPPPRGTLLVSLALFVVPVLALCAATILTLRSESALRILAG